MPTGRKFGAKCEGREKSLDAEADGEDANLGGLERGRRYGQDPSIRVARVREAAGDDKALEGLALCRSGYLVLARGGNFLWAVVPTPIGELSSRGEAKGNALQGTTEAG
ncbi:hypothetical protein KM043_012115 [Ampulex compressa]|nr:hypothetical protein KM043_012115 [Ampulex compressa]